MNKEIGSIFPLESPFRPQVEPLVGNDGQNEFLYSLCREALYDIAVSLSEGNKIVLIPAYTCQTVITPFEKAGWSCHFFSIRKDLRIDTVALEELVERVGPSLLVVHPFFGMDLDTGEIETLKRIRGRGVQIVLDLTQCIFSEQHLDFVDYYVGSYRKWFPIPDGGFLKPNNGMTVMAVPRMENEEFVTRQADAMYLRGLYFKNDDPHTKAISIRLNKLADSVAENGISVHRMSGYSIWLKTRQNEEEIRQRRYANYRFLFGSLRQGAGFRFVCTDMKAVTTAPLYFTVYSDYRAALQTLLAKYGIYAPVIWPVGEERVLVNEDVRFIYDHLLAIPCDQRYDEEDMRRVVGVMNEFQEIYAV